MAQKRIHSMRQGGVLVEEPIDTIPSHLNRRQAKLLARTLRDGKSVNMNANKKMIFLSHKVFSIIKEKTAITGTELANMLMLEYKHQNINVEFKNIQRRVYDAINVLSALDLIQKGRNGTVLYMGVAKMNTIAKSNISTEVDVREKNIMEKRNVLFEMMLQQNAIRNLIKKNLHRSDHANQKLTFPLVVVQTKGDSSIDIQMDENSRRAVIGLDQECKLYNDNHLFELLKLTSQPLEQAITYYPKRLLSLISRVPNFRTYFQQEESSGSLTLSSGSGSESWSRSISESNNYIPRESRRRKYSLPIHPKSAFTQATSTQMNEEESWCEEGSHRSHRSHRSRGSRGSGESGESGECMKSPRSGRDHLLPQLLSNLEMSEGDIHREYTQSLPLENAKGEIGKISSLFSYINYASEQLGALVHEGGNHSPVHTLQTGHIGHIGHTSVPLYRSHSLGDTHTHTHNHAHAHTDINSTKKINTETPSPLHSVEPLHQHLAMGPPHPIHAGSPVVSPKLAPCQVIYHLPPLPTTFRGGPHTLNINSHNLHNIENIDKNDTPDTPFSLEGDKVQCIDMHDDDDDDDDDDCVKMI